MLVASQALCSFVAPASTPAAVQRHGPARSLLDDPTLFENAATLVNRALEANAVPAAAAVLISSAALTAGANMLSSASQSSGDAMQYELDIQYSQDVPYKEADYQPAAAADFFRARPLVSLRRLTQLATLSGGFIASLLLDKVLKREEDDSIVQARSQQLLELVTKLGPTFIKVGQALSIRTDLLPAPYVAGLTQLQDAVPPFPGAQGRAIIESELGLNLEATFSQISLEPVASASIGQVYRATLRSSGEEVAIKVQRPRVLYEVALDLFMLREFLVPLYQAAHT